MKDTYTKALITLLKEDTDTQAVLKGFKATLDARGHESLYAPVLLRVHRQLQSTRAATHVVVATEHPTSELEASIQTALKELNITETSSYRVDQTIVGGFIVEHNHQRKDASYKTKLVNLYRSVVR